MSTKIMINLPVKDLAVSKKFFTELGFAFNDAFADENMEAVVITDDILVMLLVEPYFITFTHKQVTDTSTASEAILALAVESRERVDELADKALAAGGVAVGEPRDLGFLYLRSFTDLDGHQWEVSHIDMTAAMEAS
jgi:predicted lactoylglutathione lyase